MAQFSGKFITFEGGEGSGKSTQARLLSLYLQDIGYKTLLTREPGGTDGAESIRSLLVRGKREKWSAMTETLLLYAARADHWLKTIQPALNQGIWVVCDRFADSSLAYQGYGQGIELNFLEDLYQKIIGSYKPDKTFILDIVPERGLKRARKRLYQNQNLESLQENRFENFSYDFHQRVYEGFLKIAASEPDRCCVLNAELPLEELHLMIKQNLLI